MSFRKAQSVLKKVKSITTDFRKICMNILIPLSVLIPLISQIIDLMSK